MMVSVKSPFQMSLGGNELIASIDVGGRLISVVTANGRAFFSRSCADKKKSAEAIQKAEELARDSGESYRELLLQIGACPKTVHKRACGARLEQASDDTVLCSEGHLESAIWQTVTLREEPGMAGPNDVNLGVTSLDMKRFLSNANSREIGGRDISNRFVATGGTAVRYQELVAWGWRYRVRLHVGSPGGYVVVVIKRRAAVPLR
jgi:hypothetical protein